MGDLAVQSRSRLEPGAFQLGSLENKHYARGIRIKVPRGTKKAYIPRAHWYAPSVLTEEGNWQQLEEVYDDLEPCEVRPGLITGWGVHKCRYHLVKIEEERKAV